MRVLFTTVPASGHFTPLVPLGRALADVGHDVAVASARSFAAAIERVGFEHLPAGRDADSKSIGRIVAAHPETAALSPEELRQWIIVEVFAKTLAPAMLADRERVLDWGPDLVVREEGEFAGPILASLAGVPWVDHSWGPMRPPSAIDDVVAPLAELWAEHGLEPDDRAGFFRWLYLDVTPPTLQFPYAAEVRNTRPLRLMSPTRFDEPPSWLHELGARPCVYVTLGTTGQALDAEFFRIVLSALEHEDVDVVVTLGPGDPSLLAPIPANARVEPFIAQDLLLPSCHAVVSNGGAGSTMGALAAGVPLLIVPARGASQSRNADAVTRCGAGRSLDRERINTEVVRREVLSLLNEPQYAEVAKAIAREITELPEPSTIIPVLEQLAIDRRAADSPSKPFASPWSNDQFKRAKRI